MSDPGRGADPGERGSARARRVGLILGPALFLAALLLPDLPMDPRQRAVAATTSLTAVLWITVALPVGVTSLLPAALFPLLDVMPASEATPFYMRDLVMLFLGAFVIALGLERWGVHRRIALWIIARIGTSRHALVFGFMLAAAFLSMWINNTATTLLMLPIATAVIGKRRAAGRSQRPVRPVPAARHRLLGLGRGHGDAGRDRAEPGVPGPVRRPLPRRAAAVLRRLVLRLDAARRAVRPPWLVAPDPGDLPDRTTLGRG